MTALEKEIYTAKNGYAHERSVEIEELAQEFRAKLASGDSIGAQVVLHSIQDVTLGLAVYIGRIKS